MSERFFRSALGGSLLVFLYFDAKYAIYAAIAVLFFEGVTNFRMTSMISRLRGITAAKADESASECFHYDAQQAFRLFIAFFLLFGYVIFEEALWFLPWFAGIMLLSAGITNICPMYSFFRRLGLK